MTFLTPFCSFAVYTDFFQFIRECVFLTFFPLMFSIEFKGWVRILLLFQSTMDALFLFILLIIQILPQNNAILCHECSHKNSKEASRLQLHDRLQSSPDYCEEKNVCQGQFLSELNLLSYNYRKWCTQSLVGGNVSFGCAEHSPIEYIWEAKDISSYCSASYDVDGVSF